MLIDMAVTNWPISWFIHICKAIDIDVKYILQFIAVKILNVVYFAVDVADLFGYGKFNVFVI